MKSQIHARERVPNTARKFGSSQHYYPVVVHLPNVTRQALLTEEQLMDAIERARQNPEDVPRPSAWEKFLWWLR